MTRAPSSGSSRRATAIADARAPGDHVKPHPRFQALLWAKGALHRHEAPAALRQRIRERLSRERPARLRAVAGWLADALRRQWPMAGAGFAAGALVGALALGASVESASGELAAREVVSSHARSLMVDHLSDVVSADRDAVRSWFRGKLDYSPAVADMSQDGYGLVGGRLDYVGGRPVAAVVYAQAKHVVNVFACPLGKSAGSVGTFARRGFNAIGWADSRMQYWVVADLDLEELRRFAASLRRSDS
jgi:anti-sigma factor RsiW